jgi:hypothetical protein
MRQEAGWTAAIAVAIAAALGVTSQHGEKPLGDQSVSARTASQRDLNGPTIGVDLSLGPCAQIEKHLRSFLGIDDSRLTVVPESCYGLPKRAVTGPVKANSANRLRDAAKNITSNDLSDLRFMIATLPDPTHTHFPLEFDRMSEAIQQGASDEGYVYDSSWLPWITKDSTFGNLQDQDTADSRKEAQEEQPGILLFRRKTDAPSAQSGSASAILPYQEGLVVFIVAEEPTQGIHRDQFQNATAWIAALQTSDPNKHRLPAIILGPSFSGSVYSLAGLVSDPEIEQSPAAAGSASEEQLRIYSGNVTGNKAMAWITGALGTKAKFASFQHSDGFLISRYCEYLLREKFDLARLAILSEDQTAYGSEVARPQTGATDTSAQSSDANLDPTEGSDAGLTSCNLGLLPPDLNGINGDRIWHRPLRVFYPRDISALRAAYQSESIFSAPPSSSPDTGQHTLAPDIADPQGDQHDSIRAYSGDQKALSQEAVLQQIVSELRIHQSQYILLRSSNVLDQIFLSHYLRLGYPQGRIVILGADQLLRRESGATRLSGIMTLTTYPLLPWEPHWTQRLDGPTAHSHRVFAQDRSEGVYVATRALLHLPVTRLAGFAPVDSELTIPDYRAPFWIDPPGSAQDGPERPVAWLSVLGRNDFWPLAALTNNYDPIAGDTILKKSLRDHPAADAPKPGSFHGMGRAFLSLFNVFTSRPYGSEDTTAANTEHAAGNGAKGDRAAVSILRWQPMPMSVRFVLAGFLIACGFHFLCCFYPSATQKPSHRAYFVCVGHRLSFMALMVLGSIIISATATMLASGFGALSPDGAPLASPRFWLLSQPFFWSVACVALAINVAKQSYAAPATPKAVTAGKTAALKWWSLQGLKEYFASATDCERRRLGLWGSMIAFALGTLVFYFAYYLSTERILTVANRIPAYWRSMDFTDGVSPLVPPLVIAVGAYLWFWYSLQGLALLGCDRPRLPQPEFLRIEFDNPSGSTKKYLNMLRMLSNEGAAEPVEKLCGPFAPSVLKRAALLFALQFLLAFLFGFRHPLFPFEVPLRSLGARSYSVVICFLMGLLSSIMMANAWQLVNVWQRLRRLLMHLDRLPLRRSMAAFPGVSWNSVWTISGNVLDMRYKLLTSELRCVSYLKNYLAARDPLTVDPHRPAEAGMNSLIQEIESSRIEFARWYSRLYNEQKEPGDEPADKKLDELDQRPVEYVQKQLANFAGFLLANILVPAWRAEKGEQSATDISADGTSGQEKGREELTPVSKLDPHIRHAEQLVSYVYLGFIQNVLGRMRSLAMCILSLFIAATFAMASYPFDPRPTISGAMVLLFGVLTVAIVFVYAQIHRDPILSLVTNTKPGELGGAFWLKLLGFGAGPVLGLLTTLFPQLTDFLFSWVQPSLTSIK